MIHSQNIINGPVSIILFYRYEWQAASSSGAIIFSLFLINDTL